MPRLAQAKHYAYRSVSHACTGGLRACLLMHVSVKLWLNTLCMFTVVMRSGVLPALLLVCLVFSAVAKPRIVLDEGAASLAAVEALEHQRILAELEEVHRLRERMLQEGEACSGNIHCCMHLCNRQLYAHCSWLTLQMPLHRLHLWLCMLLNCRLWQLACFVSFAHVSLCCLHRCIMMHIPKCIPIMMSEVQA